MPRTSARALAVLAMLAGLAPAAAQPPPRITVLFDAFGDRPGLERDWGYAALVEHAGRRILFDTGNDAEAFAANVRRLGVDLKALDLVVISHRHGDHTDGLRHLLAVNPAVPIYVPADEYFGGPTPPAFFRSSTVDLPPRMRYFGGAVPSEVPHGTAWDGARFVRVEGEGLELAPGVRVVQNLSPTRQFGETPELSLVLATDRGPVVVVGCSHPGIERILASVGGEDPVALLVGGLHLVTTEQAEVSRLATALRDEWRLGAVAPGHCTGEPAFAALAEAFGERYLYAGVGGVVELPPAPPP